MREAILDLWDFPTAWRAVTTNGCVKSDGTCTMGAGVAKQVRDRIPGFDAWLGRVVSQYGNRVFINLDHGWVTYPTKYHWADPSDMNLIRISAIQLMEVVAKYQLPYVLLPRPGCDNGGLSWGDVKPVISSILDHRVIAVSCLD
jgi:hypothetical protein